MLDDGTAGLLAIKARGGTAIAQDPDDALYPGMPSSAIEHVKVDHVVAVPAIAALLAELAQRPPELPDPPPPSPLRNRRRRGQTEELAVDLRAHGPVAGSGQPSIFACPDCDGVLWEIQDGRLIRFRCNVGHAWSPESLLSHQSEALEALWAALRSLQERAALARRMADPARRRRHSLVSLRFNEQAREAEQAAAVLRELLLKRSSVAGAQEDQRAADERGHHRARP